MEELYSLKNSSIQAADDQRSEKTRQQENNIEERRLGELLLESAESTEPRSRNTQSESDGGNRTSNKYDKKRITLQQLQQQQEDAISHVKDQKSIMEQQLLLQREDIEHKKEKARKQEEKERKQEEKARKQEEIERDKERDKDDREYAKELRDREWEREKLKEAQRREDERNRRQHESEERRHKEVMDMFRQQASTNQLLTQLMLNTHQNSSRDSFIRPNTQQPSEDGHQRND
ncbi:hypothetical protein BGW38_001630 [Lunasporangiospora selenospora]|uniref:Uncharacterized protein n=1 Tax=Lunasporangiospora selenospora TaxID=979761 RepID=A0A9P6KE04_9FUNG|nr:hypothetical protein BGW38_001630 [Lunasporangiospora selenospora]